MVATSSGVTRNGQVTIPAAMCPALGIEEGTPVESEPHGETDVLRKAERITERTKGVFATYRKSYPLTPDDERQAYIRAIIEDADNYPGR